MQTRYSTEKLNVIVQNVGAMMTQSKSDVIKFREFSLKEELEINEHLISIQNDINKIINRQDAITEELVVLKQNLSEHTKAHSILKSQASENALKSIYDRLGNLSAEFNKNETNFKSFYDQREFLMRKLTDSKKRITESMALIATLSTAYSHIMNDMENISELIYDKQNSVLKVLKAQELEKQYIARELHDGVVQTLAQLSIETKIVDALLKKDKKKQAIDSLVTLDSHITRAISESRELIFNLKPMALDDVGLIATLKQYINSQLVDKTSKFKFEFVPIDNYGKALLLSDSIKLVVFRVIQESVNNAIKHSQGSIIQIGVDFDKESVTICITDNGVGFNAQVEVKNSRQDNRFGIVGMLERIDMVNGELNYTSSPKTGTTITFKIPYQIA